MRFCRPVPRLCLRRRSAEGYGKHRQCQCSDSFHSSMSFIMCRFRPSVPASSALFPADWGGKMRQNLFPERAAKVCKTIETRKVFCTKNVKSPEIIAFSALPAVLATRGSAFSVPVPQVTNSHHHQQNDDDDDDKSSDIHCVLCIFFTKKGGLRTSDAVEKRIHHPTFSANRKKKGMPVPEHPDLLFISSERHHPPPLAAASAKADEGGGDVP